VILGDPSSLKEDGYQSRNNGDIATSGGGIVGKSSAVAYQFCNSMDANDPSGKNLLAQDDGTAQLENWPKNCIYKGNLGGTHGKL